MQRSGGSQGAASTSQLTLPEFYPAARRAKAQSGIEAPSLQKEKGPSIKTPPDKKPQGGPGRGHKKNPATSILDRWNEPGEKGFYAWLKDIQPKILTKSNTYETFTPTGEQKGEISKILEVDKEGSFKYSMSILCQPRRFGKSTVFALLVLWLITSRKNLVIQLLGNTESHIRRTQFRALERIINNTPKLSRIIPADNITQFSIVNKINESIIQMPTGKNLATAFGEKINVLWTSDLHASVDLDPFNALQASLLDSENSLCWIDSNVDHDGGPVHNLQKEAKVDDGIYSKHTSFRNLRHYNQDAPDWINRDMAHRLKRTLLPADFKRDILGQRSALKNTLFSPEIIEKCKDAYKIPVSDISSLTKGRAYKIGGALDRAKGLFGDLVGNDNTVWSVVLKVASVSQGGEPEYYLLNQEVIFPNTARMVKKAILRDHEKFDLNNVVLEAYEVTDLISWVADQKIPVESVTAHENNQSASFTEMFRIAKEGRLHFPAKEKGLVKEMGTFTYIQRKGGQRYSFGASGRKDHDDRVYSLNWSIFSLRDVVLQLYTMGNIACRNKSPKRSVCVLMGGDMTLLCARQCQTYKNLEEMFKSYKAVRPEDPINLAEFFHQKVKLEGARISQAV